MKHGEHWWADDVQEPLARLVGVPCVEKAGYHAYEVRRCGEEEGLHIISAETFDDATMVIIRLLVVCVALAVMKLTLGRRWSWSR